MKFQAIVSVLAVALTFTSGHAQADAEDNAAELAKKLANPIASLISVPIKFDWNTNIGAADADRSTYVIQPVIPFELNPEWNVISRTIVPVYIEAESPVEGGGETTGMGDILQSFFISPKAPTASGWIWGAGPVLSMPTGDDGLTSDKFSVGPTAVVLKQISGWTVGALANHLWSVSGDASAPDVSSTFIQPFIAYTTKTHTTIGMNTESAYDWETEEWTAPINLTIAQVLKFGNQPMQFQLGYRNFIDSPNNLEDWGLRFQVTLLFPQ